MRTSTFSEVDGKKTCKVWVHDDWETPQQKVPDRYRGEGLLVDVGQLVDDDGGCGEDPVRVQEGVEEVNGEEAQVRQALQQPLHAGVADLRHLAGIERLAETDVDVVLVQSSVGSLEREVKKTKTAGLFFSQA